MNKDECEFVIYMIHACANKWGQSPSVVYKKLNESGCISNYLVQHYPILHTQGTECIVEDIEIYLKTHDSKVVPKMCNRSR